MAAPTTTNPLQYDTINVYACIFHSPTTKQTHPKKHNAIMQLKRFAEKLQKKETENQYPTNNL